MRKTKAIAYAFPSSTNAKKLGFNETGCFYVQETLIDIEGGGQCNSGMVHNTHVSIKPDDADLIAFFNECEGDICQHFIRHGNVKALKALGY